MTSTRTLKPLTLTGPAGQIEALAEGPEHAPASVAVVCHPHPLHGGTMTNKVVHTLAKSFVAKGAVAIRFNYRGVGASAGKYDEGMGETEDTLAVIDWARQQWPEVPLWLGGFSFGGAVAIRAAAQRPVQRLVTVAPAVDRVNVEGAELSSIAWLLVHGDKDELVDAAHVMHWARGLQHPPHIALLPGVDHFFHGRLNDLRDAVVGWIDADSGGRSHP
jgi:alpha/beta superfamily hydrolase